MLRSMFIALAANAAFATFALPAASANDLQLASLDQAAASPPPPGDRMTVIRPFNAWALRCELSIARNKRLCALEQLLQTNGTSLFWRLAQTSDNRTVLIFAAPLATDAAKGLTLTLDSTATQLAPWSCRQTCLAVGLMTKDLQASLSNAKAVTIAWTTNQGTPVSVSGSMAGFATAIKAAADDPFGKRPLPQKPMPKKLVKPKAPTPVAPTSSGQ